MKGKIFYDNIAYGDVTQKLWQSKRHTNPLMPTYTVWDSSTGEFGKKPETCIINNNYGVIDGNKPTSLPKGVEGVRNLNTLDIVGA